MGRILNDMHWVSKTLGQVHLRPGAITSCIWDQTKVMWMPQHVINNWKSCSFKEVQVSSVAQSCPTLCNPMNCSTPGVPVHHQLLEFIKLMSIELVMPSSHLILSSPSPPAPNPSQHQSLFQWVSSSHEGAKVLDFQPQHQSFQWTPRTDL